MSWDESFVNQKKFLCPGDSYSVNPTKVSYKPNYTQLLFFSRSSFSAIASLTQSAQLGSERTNSSALTSSLTVNGRDANCFPLFINFCGFPPLLAISVFTLDRKYGILINEGEKPEVTSYQLSLSGYYHFLNVNAAIQRIPKRRYSTYT